LTIWYILVFLVTVLKHVEFFSRFGKFVEIQFDKYGKISGAAVRTYLLERSRVCQVSDPERNYHCFYMLCNAPPEVILKNLNLTSSFCLVKVTRNQLIQNDQLIAGCEKI
jgi:hypothetical protein